MKDQRKRKTERTTGGLGLLGLGLGDIAGDIAGSAAAGIATNYANSLKWKSSWKKEKSDPSWGGSARQL